MNKKALSLMHQIVIHLILIALLFGMFFLSISMRVDSDDVKQQVLEKEIALLIDSAIPGVTIVVDKVYLDGDIKSLEIIQERVFVSIGGAESNLGYPYFTKYSVRLNSDPGRYYITIGEEA